MFAVVVSIFLVCWGPYHIYFIYSYHYPSITKIPYISHIYLGFYWLAMSNTCVNPIIYYWMNRRFRAYFNTVLFCVPRVLKRATSRSWPIDGQSENSPTGISRTQSCISRHNSQYVSVSTIPVRAMGLQHSVSFQPDSYTARRRTNTPIRHFPSDRSFSRKMRSCDSIQSNDSLITHVAISEAFF